MPPDRTLAPLDSLPSRREPLKEAKPFLMPLGGPNDTHVTLPPEKENRAIRFSEETLVTDIENRFYLNDFPEDDEEGSYEIEIVEDDGDADFYLEIVDGEVFYVFETEDDISVDSDEEEGSGDGLDHDEQHDTKKQEDSNETQLADQLNSSMRLNLDGMMLAPDLEGEDNSDAGPPLEITIPPVQPDAATMEALNQSLGQEGAFMNLADFMDSPEEATREDKPKVTGDMLSEMMEDDEPRKRNNLQSEETLLLMEDEDDEEHQLAEPTKSTTPSMKRHEVVLEEDWPPQIQESPIFPAKPWSENKKGTASPSTVPDAAPVAPSRKVSLTVEERKALEKQKPVFGQMSSIEELPIAPAPAVQSSSLRNKQRATSPASPHYAIQTGSTTASMIHTPPPSSPSPTSPSKTRSILKSNCPSPKKECQKKDRKKKTEKTFSKTYVRADQLDGEHRVYTWTKPDWTQKTNKLRPTGKGDEIRQGKSLAAPITFFPKKPVNNGIDSDVDMETLVTKAIKAGSQASSILGPSKKLKFSVNGDKLRQGEDIVKPITKATMLRKPENINKVANPGVLKATPVGKEVRKGGTLAAPVTFPAIKFDDKNPVANMNVLRRKGVAPATKQYEWQKPDWTTKAHLKNTPVGEAVKKGADLQGPITQAPHTRGVRRTASMQQDSISDHGSGSGSDSGETHAAVAYPRRGRRNVPARTASMPMPANPSSGDSIISSLSMQSVSTHDSTDNGQTKEPPRRGRRNLPTRTISDSSGEEQPKAKGTGRPVGKLVNRGKWQND